MMGESITNNLIYRCFKPQHHKLARQRMSTAKTMNPHNDIPNNAANIASMTGFGRAEMNTPHGHIIWELRSVNQRYLDITWRLPEAFRVLETECREYLNSHIKRGKIEASLRFEPRTSATAFTINRDLITALATAADDISQQLINQHVTDIQSLSLNDIMRWPGVLESNDAANDKQLEQNQDAAITAFEQAVHSLQETRQAEGQRIVSLFDTRLESMANYVAEIRQWQPELRQQLQQKLLQRMADLDINRDDMDAGRIEQEIALGLQKIDVAEELDRLDAHINEFDQVLTANNQEPVGPRLNFLTQEMNREANTLGSKVSGNSQGLAQSHAAIELKVLIEQIREQVLNVE